MSVIGRFAPSPTGSLHFGSTVAAIASYMHAKNRYGQWLVRMDDIDISRNQKGSDSAILKSLEILGLHWDDKVLFQSHRKKFYQEVLNLLLEKCFLYRCTCTRKELQGNIYPGTCRKKKNGLDRQHALRILSKQKIINFDDKIQGYFEQNLETETGDFIVRRADGFVAYHLATVIDDAYQGVTEILRGADLLDSTPRQIYLQNLLNYTTPMYAHLPVAIDKQGNKLSKQYHAKPIDDADPVTTLILALNFLGQRPEKSLAQGSVNDIIQWGIKHWSLEKIPQLNSIIVENN